MILAGDVGGSKTLLGLFEPAEGRPRVVREASFRSQAFDSFEAIVEEFVGEGEKVDRCAVGVAGPVLEGRSQVVNLRWPVDERRLVSGLGIERVRVLNDLEATAWGIPVLSGRQTVNLTPGLRSRPGNRVLIAAGTGLGMALLCWDGERHLPSASEGGHQSFGPRDDLEIDLLRYLRRRHGRVSVERIVAGPGISAIYQFLIDSGRGTETAVMVRRLAEADDSNAAIAQAGLAGEDATAVATLDRFVSLYGAAAGDLALVGRAVGGVFVGGGIAPKILPKLRSGDFLSAFRSKGRLSPFVEKIPVRVVLEPRTALLGAAVAASRIPGRPGSRSARRRSRTRRSSRK